MIDVSKKAIVNLPVRLKGNSLFRWDNSLCQSAAENKDIDAASQTLLGGVRLRLQWRIQGRDPPPPLFFVDQTEELLASVKKKKTLKIFLKNLKYIII